MRFALLVAVAAVALGGAGCASDAPEAAPMTSAPLVAYQPPPLPPLPPPAPITDPDAPKVGLYCTRARRAPGFRWCKHVTKRAFRVVIQRRTSDGWKLVAWEPRDDLEVFAGARGGMSNGLWDGLDLSPDGSTLLGTWRTECEIQYAFFIPAKGGRPVPATGESDANFRSQSPGSRGIAWASDGRARVYVGGGGCSDGKGWRPGEYLIDPVSGEATFLHS